MANHFLNYSNASVTVSTSRLVNAQATDVNDIVNANNEKNSEVLTASLDIFIKEEAQKIMAVAERCKSSSELWEFVLGEGDFLELLLEREFGMALADYPELRDLQKQQFEHIEFEF